MVMRDLDQNHRGYPNWEEEKMVPAQQGCLQLVTSRVSPSCPFQPRKQGRGKSAIFFVTRLKRKQSMNGHNLVGSRVNLYFALIIECIP